MGQQVVIQLAQEFPITLSYHQQREISATLTASDRILKSAEIRINDGKKGN